MVLAAAVSPPPSITNRQVVVCLDSGLCPSVLGGLLAARDEYGVVCSVVGGGQQALAHTRRPDVKAVVAVACERELLQGILAAFPKPVFAVCNARPDGPCRNTRVDLSQVEAALDLLVDTRRE